MRRADLRTALVAALLALGLPGTSARAEAPAVRTTGIEQSAGVLRVSVGLQDLFQPSFYWEKSLYPWCVQRGMRRVKAITYDAGNYYLWLMAKPDSPVAKYLEQWHPTNAVPQVPTQEKPR